MPIPKLVVTAALMAAQVALSMTRKIEGPRLDELDVSVADYGTPLPRFWGIRRFQTPIIWAEKLREKKKKSKTKGGKYAEYKYFGTWAVAIADQEIDAVKRLWLDKHLVYQVAGEGPIAAFISAAIDPDAQGADIKLQKNNIAIYLGTEDQEADPRMDAWCEDRYGANSCPAYRGVAYMVFKDIPLEKFGNRIPQVTVEAVSNKTDAFPSTTRSTDYSLINSQFSPDYNTLYAGGSGTFEIWDVPTRTRIAVIATTGGSFAAAPGGFFALNSFAGQSLIFVTNGGGESIITENSEIPAIMGDVYYVGGQVYTIPAAGTDAYALARVGIGASFVVTSLFADLDGNAVAVGVDGTNLKFFNEGTGQAFAVTTAGSGDPYGFTNADGHYVVVQSTGEAFVVDSVAETILESDTITVTGDAYSQIRAVATGSSTFWLGINEYDATDLSTLRVIDPSDWAAIGAIQGYLYDPINNAIIAKPLFSAQFTWLYLDRIGNDGVLLSDIVGDVSDWVGIEGYDYSDLDQMVDGYSVTQGSGKDMIAPLLDIHDSDLRPHDFQVQGIKRGDASGGTILTSEFVRDGDEARYVVSIAQDTDLARKITFNFADVDKDQQTNTVIAQRPLDTVDGVREQTIDLTTYALEAADAQKLADRYFRRMWNSRETIQLALTAQNLALEPGDVRTLSLDGVTRNARLTKLTLSQGALKTEWTRDFGGLNSLGTGTGAEMEGRDPEVIFVPGPTKGFVLDIPLVQDGDSDANPLLYFGAGNFDVGSWPGATVYQGDPDGEDYSDFAGVPSSSEATWGYTTDALADANPWLWDRGNSVNVNTFGSTLTSSTEAAIDANPLVNLAYLGGELLNFVTATLEADGTYTLSGFKRGRRGTEWATGSHAIGDEFVLVSSLATEGMGLSDVGNNETFKAQTFGRDPEGAAVIELEPFTGATLKPYAPARVKWTTDGTDYFGEIIRRTRVGGAWVGGTTIPLSENSEAYEVDIMDGDDVLRTISVTGTNTFTYTAAMMSADGNALGTPPSVNVYQLSDAVGRGFALAA